MRALRTPRVVAGAVVILLVAVISPLRAHDVLYRGTVVAVQPEQVQVKTTDEKTKKEDTLSFKVTAKTRVKRGTATVPYASAAIAGGERIVVVVNHDAEAGHVATELRLAAK